VAEREGGFDREGVSAHGGGLVADRDRAEYGELVEAVRRDRLIGFRVQVEVLGRFRVEVLGWFRVEVVGNRA